MNMSRANILSNISALFFNVRIAGGLDNGGLSPGAIAGIVIGSIAAFLLACLLIALCVWCCCFRLGWCLWCCFCCPCLARCCRCCPGASAAAAASANSKKKYSDQTSSKSRLYSSGRYDTGGGATRQRYDNSTNDAGFDDVCQRTRPNYVINSITKSTSSIADPHQHIGKESDLKRAR